MYIKGMLELLIFSFEISYAGAFIYAIKESKFPRDKKKPKKKIKEAFGSVFLMNGLIMGIVIYIIISVMAISTLGINFKWSST